MNKAKGDEDRCQRIKAAQSPSPKLAGYRGTALARMKELAPNKASVLEYEAWLRRTDPVYARD